MRIVAAIAGGIVALLCAFAETSAQQPPPGPATSAPSPTPAPPSVDAFYSAAVESMRELPQPRYLTYTMEGAGDHLSIDLQVENHLVWLEMTTGMTDGYPQVWNIRHRTDDYSSEIVEDDGRRLVSTRAFFDPTWYGAFRALRDGMLMYQKDEEPASTYATPTPGPSPDLRTIAVVSVIGSAIYRVVDAGAATCGNGDQGHALRLVSKDRNPRHQLANVVIDLRNMHFCTMRFNSSESGFSGSVEEHFSDVGGYWLQTDGIIETGVRALGIQLGHGVWRYRLSDVTFPREIPAAAFLRPFYQ